MPAERYQAICHVRHGWVVAPEGAYFTPSKTGKTIELHEPNYVAGYHYPFGTSFRATSVIAMEEVERAT